MKSVPNPSPDPFLPPTQIDGSSQALHLDSVLEDLPRYHFHIEATCLGDTLAQIFEQNPRLPGALLTQQGEVFGMVSRQRFLESLIRPQGLELFLKQPLTVLYSYTRTDVLLLPGNTPILVAAHQALRRSPTLLAEPIIVQVDPHTSYLLDLHELNIAYWQIRGLETQVRYERTQAQMIQSDKMANLGRLVDGVAHEILDPISFIWGNLSHVATYGTSLLEMLQTYKTLLPNPPMEVRRRWEELEIDYLQEDLPCVIRSIQGGADRLSKLATSLQNFCHIDEVYPKPANLHELIDGILLLLKSRLTSEIQVIKRYGHLPPIPCYMGQLNQVLMNILSNAVDVLLDQAVSQQFELDGKTRRGQFSATPAAPKPTITITTQVCSLGTETGERSRWVSICIADNGPGLSPEARSQILDSFSIKRRALKETNLAVSYQIITAKHGGKFEVRSRNAASGEFSNLNQDLVIPFKTLQNSTNQPQNLSKETGTEFEILLPLT